MGSGRGGGMDVAIKVSNTLFTHLPVSRFDSGNDRKLVIAC